MTDPFLPVLSMGCIAITLCLLKLLSKKVYKAWAIDILETTFLLNLAFLAYGTQYVQLTKKASTITITVLANVSMGLSLCLFALIICYHSYKYVYLQSSFYRKHKSHINEVVEKTRNKFRRGPKRPERKDLPSDTESIPYIAMESCHQREPDLDVLAPITIDDYRPAPPPNNPHSHITYSVVDITEA